MASNSAEREPLAAHLKGQNENKKKAPEVSPRGQVSGRESRHTPGANSSIFALSLHGSWASLIISLDRDSRWSKRTLKRSGIPSLTAPLQLR
jgi:hypothetical protein